MEKPHRTFNFPSLPIELKHDILSRLPSKPLHISKCVSKQWHSIITSPEFIQFHTLRSLSSPRSNRLLVIDTEHYLSTLDFDDTHNNTLFKPNIPRHSIFVIPDDGSSLLFFVGTCNGLVCILVDGLCAVMDHLFVYNPFTRRVWTVPDLDDLGVWLYGFGYDSVSDDYKIIRIPYPPRGIRGNPYPNRCEGYLFSFRSWSWSSKRVDSKLLQASTSSWCVFMDGYIHWDVLLDGNFRLGPTSVGIGRLGVSSEEYNLMELPEMLSRGNGCNSGCIQLGAIEGMLSLQVMRYRDQFDVWVMKEYGVSESWNRLFRVNHSSGCMDAIAYSTNGDRILVFWDYDFYWYDTEGKELEHAGYELEHGGYIESQDGNTDQLYSSIIVCDGTLISPVCGDHLQLRQLG